MTRDAKKKGFYRYIKQKRKVQKPNNQKRRPYPPSEQHRQVSNNKEKADISTTSLPQSSIATVLRTVLEWMVKKVGTGGAVHCK